MGSGRARSSSDGSLNGSMIGSMTDRVRNSDPSRPRIGPPGSEIWTPWVRGLDPSPSEDWTRPESGPVRTLDPSGFWTRPDFGRVGRDSSAARRGQSMCRRTLAPCTRSPSMSTPAMVSRRRRSMVVDRDSPARAAMVSAPCHTGRSSSSEAVAMTVRIIRALESSRHSNTARSRSCSFMSASGRGAAADAEDASNSFPTGRVPVGQDGHS